MLEKSMFIKVNYLENLRLEALFDDFNVVADQPVRYKGDGLAPGPFDYFLASSVMCAAYFIKVYCKARDIPTDDIKVSQNNIVDPENRYQQTFHIQVELPSTISEHDRTGILRSIERCTVKKVIQQGPEFKIEIIDTLGKETNTALKEFSDRSTQTKILGKDSSLEETIDRMTALIDELGIDIEIASWRNLIPHVWSVHVRDADSPLCYTNGKGATKKAALCSALGEYLERLSTNYFYNDYYLGKESAQADFVHYPNEKWFSPNPSPELPEGLMDNYLLNIYNPEGELKFDHLIDTNSGNTQRGICALPYIRQSDQEVVYIPVNLIGNLFVSNGMSAGNSRYEARVQAISEIFERAVKNKIITEEIVLPDVPQDVLSRYPQIVEGIQELESRGYPVFVKDASLGGQYPVMCVTIMIPQTGGTFCSFGAHPTFEVALERSLTELLQGRSFEGLKDLPAPTFNEHAIQEENNIIDHFIDSAGVISWKFFSTEAEYPFHDWNYSGTTEEEYTYLMEIFSRLEKEVYIADYEELGAYACRVLVPDYSEIYGVDDLIWDNNNKSLQFREDILNLHDLSENEQSQLVERLEESELDDYMPISELIGVTFDDASTWGRLTIGELKCLLYLSLGLLELAQTQLEMLSTFNDTTEERKKFFQILHTIVDIELREDLELEQYKESLIKMYGAKLYDSAQQSVAGTLTFFGLTETNTNLEGLDKHQRLIASYKKLQKKRADWSRHSAQ